MIEPVRLDAQLVGVHFLRSEGCAEGVHRSADIEAAGTIGFGILGIDAGIRREIVTDDERRRELRTVGAAGAFAIGHHLAQLAEIAEPGVVGNADLARLALIASVA